METTFTRATNFWSVFIHRYSFFSLLFYFILHDYIIRRNTIIVVFYRIFYLSWKICLYILFSKYKTAGIDPINFACFLVTWGGVPWRRGFSSWIVLIIHRTYKIISNASTLLHCQAVNYFWKAVGKTSLPLFCKVSLKLRKDFL